MRKINICILKKKKKKSEFKDSIIFNGKKKERERGVITQRRKLKISNC